MRSKRDYVYGMAVMFMVVLNTEAGLTTDVLRATARFSVGTSTNTGNQATALGDQTVSTGYASHSEGFQTRAIGNASHAEGANTIATNVHAHAEGYGTGAYGAQSHAEGNATIAHGPVAHAQGYSTAANASFSHSGGNYSRVPTAMTSAFIHASGVSTNYKEAKYPYTAHFDRLYTFEASNSDSNSVMARWENDIRYLRVDTNGFVGVNTATPSARLDVNGDARFVNGARIPASGDISMGDFTNGSL